MCKESNEDDTKRHYRTNKQRALTSLQLVYSCVFTCFRFASTLNMLLCLLFCAFVSQFQSSSMFPKIDFSPVCEFLVNVHTAKTGLLKCCLYTSRRLQQTAVSCKRSICKKKKFVKAVRLRFYPKIEHNELCRSIINLCMHPLSSTFFEFL